MDQVIVDGTHLLVRLVVVVGVAAFHIEVRHFPCRLLIKKGSQLNTRRVQYESNKGVYIATIRLSLNFEIKNAQKTPFGNT